MHKQTNIPTYLHAHRASDRETESVCEYAHEIFLVLFSFVRHKKLLVPGRTLLNAAVGQRQDLVTANELKCPYC